MTGFIKKQLVLLKFNLNCIRTTNNSSLNCFSEQNGAKMSKAQYYVAQGFWRFGGQNKTIFQSLSKRYKIKKFFLFIQHKLISEIFCPFVHRTFFLFKKKEKRLRNKAFGSKKFMDKMQKNFVRILSISPEFCP